MTTLEALRDLADQMEAAKQTLELVRQKRDEAIRAVRQTTNHTVTEIADAAGVSEATVKTVVRGLARIK